MDQESEKTGDAEPVTTDRRQCKRVQFSATAFLTDTSTGGRVQVRVADLSKGGCYVDLLNPLPVGTSVIISIQHANKSFSARGTVGYALPRMGMGITFSEVATDQLAVLQEWLGPDFAGINVTTDRAREAPVYAMMDSTSRDVTEQLIMLLLRQQVITKDQAAELLQRLRGEPAEFL